MGRQRPAMPSAKPGRPGIQRLEGGGGGARDFWPDRAPVSHVCGSGAAFAHHRFKLDFRGYAARFSQARRRMLISSGVGWSGRDALNLAAMMTRRSLAAMPAVDGWALLAYQGARAR